MKIKVTSEHISKGVCGDEKNCAIALAVIEALNLDPSSVAVDTDGIRFYDGEEFFCLRKTPEYVADFIDQFDADLPVGPIEFELEPPDWRAA